MKTQWGILTFIIYFIASSAYSYLAGSPPIMTALIIHLFIFALLLIGLHFIWSGRKEFGDEHERFATIGCWLIPISILVWLLGGTLGVAVAYVGRLLPGPIVDIVVITVSLFLSALAFVFMVYHLENTIGKIFLVAGFLTVVGSVVVIVVAPGVEILIEVLSLAYFALTILAYVFAFGRVLELGSSDVGVLEQIEQDV